MKISSTLLGLALCNAICSYAQTGDSTQSSGKLSKGVPGELIAQLKEDTTAVGLSSVELDAKKRSYGESKPFGVLCDINSVVGPRFDDLNKLIRNGAILVELKVAGASLADRAASFLLVHQEADSRTLASWSFYAGAGLLAGLTSDNRMSDSAATRAQAYLTFAKERGSAAAADALKILEKRLTPNAAASFKAGVPTLTSVSIVQQQLDNEFAFWKKYEGQTIAVTGQIRAIYGGRVPEISINGAPKSVGPQEAGYQHWVSCLLKQPSEIEKLERLKKGQTVKVVGVVRHGADYSFQITLEDCAVL